VKRDPGEYSIRLKRAIASMPDDRVRSHLVDAIHSLSIVATGLDGDQEMTLEEMKAGARGLLATLEYAINE